MSYEPSKRLILKNLPPDCSKNEIIDFIRRRSGIMPRAIEIGHRPDGTQRQFAHATVESLKSVITAVNDAPIRPGFTVVAEQAKPHFTILLQAAFKRKREEKVDNKNESRPASEDIKNIKEKIITTENETVKSGDDDEKRFCISISDGIHIKNKDDINFFLDNTKIKSFFHGKRRYAKIAAEIAASALKEACRKDEKNFHNLSKYSISNKNSYILLNNDLNNKFSNINFKENSINTNNLSNLNSTNKKHILSYIVESKESQNLTPSLPIQNEYVSPLTKSKEEKKIAELQARLFALRAKLSAK